MLDCIEREKMKKEYEKRICICMIPNNVKKVEWNYVCVCQSNWENIFEELTLDAYYCRE